MAKRLDGFQRRGRGVFKCCTCNRSTRQTGETGDSECCSQCYDLAGWENHISDNGLEDVSERDRACIREAWNAAIKAGGCAESMRRQFDKSLVDIATS